jgi:hypothetical protein
MLIHTAEQVVACAVNYVEDPGHMAPEQALNMASGVCPSPLALGQI